MHLSIIAGMLVSVGIWLLGERRKRPTVLVRWVLLAIGGGMAGYLLLALPVIRLPQTAWAARLLVAAIVAAGALIPLALVGRGEEGHHGRS